jgi:hypothetical protein
MHTTSSPYTQFAFTQQTSSTIAATLTAIDKVETPLLKVPLSIKASLNALATPPIPVVSHRRPAAKQSHWYQKTLNAWLIFTIVVAGAASIISTFYVFQHHWTLAYGDAVSHMEIGRRIFDNLTPGLAQLGDVWLPLPHLLIALFAWNDYLWKTGLGGSCVGMICYLITTIHIFLTVSELTDNQCAAFVSSLIYILNPNVLYLQATPLTEPVCQATFTIACYYMFLWSKKGHVKYLVLTAGSTFLATLARYDGWILLIIFPVVIVITGILKHEPIRKIEGNLFVFLTQGSLGIILWLIWGQIIFGDPLYFQHGPFSSQQQTMSGVNGLMEKGNLLFDLRLYSTDVIETLGIGLFILSAVGLVIFLYKHWKAPETPAVLAFLVPFAFYVLAIFTGQVGLFDIHSALYLSGIIPANEMIHLFNARFGSEMVAPAAIFVSMLVPSWRLKGNIFHYWLKAINVLLLVLLIICQSMWIMHGGVISIIQNIDPPFCVVSYPLNVYLEQHYNGGRILQMEFPYEMTESASDIDFRNIVYEGSGPLWQEAIKHPDTAVDWIIFSPGDKMSQYMTSDGPTFTHNFSLVASGPTGLRLYHKKNLPPLPTRPISPYLSEEQRFCSAQSYPQK